VRHDRAADGRVRAHVDREGAVEVGRARDLHGAADLHPDVRPDAVEPAERTHRILYESLQRGGIRRIDAEGGRAELGGERGDARAVDVAECEPIAAGGQQPRPGIADSGRAAEHERPLRHGPGF
jgi:hypothetical protein